MGCRMQPSFAALNLLRKLRKGCGKEKAGLQFAGFSTASTTLHAKKGLRKQSFLHGAGDGSRTHVLSLEG